MYRLKDLPFSLAKQQMMENLKCALCASVHVTKKCEGCNQQLFCHACDEMFHRHPKRKTHKRVVN